METFPVFWGDWSSVQEKQLNIALNNPSLQGRYDEPKLRDLLIKISEEGGTMAATGFEDLELARFLKKIGTGQAAPDDVPDEVERRAVVGDRWVLGNHVLICGDSTDPRTLDRLWGDGPRPVLCVTDPPYGVEYEPEWRAESAERGLLGATPRRIGKVTNDDRADWSEVWKLCGCDVIYAWCAAGDLMVTAGNALLDSGYQIRASIIWRKPHFPISRGHYTFTHEPAWYAVRKGATASWIGDSSASTVWDVALDKNVPGGHSTQKPVELFTMAIGNHQGDVFEPFAGSGTCLIACEKLGRKCFAIEIEPHYCDVILARWETFTGESAVLAERITTATNAQDPEGERRSGSTTA
jgi:DNA modification methylase